MEGWMPSTVALVVDDVGVSGGLCDTAESGGLSRRDERFEAARGVLSKGSAGTGERGEDGDWPFSLRLNTFPKSFRAPLGARSCGGGAGATGALGCGGRLSFVFSELSESRDDVGVCRPSGESRYEPGGALSS